ncbi:MAG: dihydropyrimidinase, partial [Rhodobacteraceae bacterium]|nr:dihydropyrimidinase [Paracoccaceae bacterium]
RGQVAVFDGEVRTQEGHGKFVKREGNTATNKALSSWKELTAPTPVKRTGIPASGV